MRAAAAHVGNLHLGQHLGFQFDIAAVGDRGFGPGLRLLVGATVGHQVGQATAETLAKVDSSVGHIGVGPGVGVDVARRHHTHPVQGGLALRAAPHHQAGGAQGLARDEHFLAVDQVDVGNRRIANRDAGHGAQFTEKAVRAAFHHQHTGDGLIFQRGWNTVGLAPGGAGKGCTE